MLFKSFTQQKDVGYTIRDLAPNYFTEFDIQIQFCFSKSKLVIK